MASSSTFQIHKSDRSIMHMINDGWIRWSEQSPLPNTLIQCTHTKWNGRFIQGWSQDIEILIDISFWWRCALKIEEN